MNHKLNKGENIRGQGKFASFWNIPCFVDPFGWNLYKIDIELLNF